MKIEKITIRYSTTIPIMQYGVNDKVDAEITYTSGHDNASLREDHIDYLIPHLKKQVDDIVKKTYPHLYNSTDAMDVYIEQKKQQDELLKKSFKIPIPTEKTNGNEQPEEQKPLLQLIQESKTVKELKAWRLLIQVQKNKDELQKAYDEKMEQLQNQPA